MSQIENYASSAHHQTVQLYEFYCAFHNLHLEINKCVSVLCISQKDIPVKMEILEYLRCYPNEIHVPGVSHQ